MARAGASQGEGRWGEHLRSPGEVKGFQSTWRSGENLAGSESSHAGLGELGQVSV